MPNTVVYLEISCINTEEHLKFYEELFDLEITPPSDKWNYRRVHHSEG